MIPQAVEVRNDDTPARQADEAPALEVSQQPRHQLAHGADLGRDLLVRLFEREGCQAIGRGRAEALRALGSLDQIGGQALVNLVKGEALGE